MRTIIELVERAGDLPLLQLYIHDAPHRRSAEKHHKVIENYRDELVAAATAAGIKIPITRPIELAILFVDPLSPDLDNVIMCCFRAMDGTSHSKPTVLRDDGLIESVSAAKFYPNGRKKNDSFS